MENLLRSCVKVCEAIKLTFWVVSGVGSGICVLDGRRGVRGIFLTEKCIRLGREKFMIFPYGQYISGNVVYSFLIRCSLLRDRSWHLPEIC